MQKLKKVIIIGGNNLSSLYIAKYLANIGFTVTIIDDAKISENDVH